MVPYFKSFLSFVFLYKYIINSILLYQMSVSMMPYNLASYYLRKTKASALKLFQTGT